MKGLIILMSLMQAIVSLGCASHQVKPVSVKPIETYPICTRVDDIWFAAEPCDSSEKAKDMFYLDVTSKGYFPVFVVFKNDDKNNNILVIRESAVLDCGGSIYRPVRSTAMYNDFERSKMAYALLGFGIFSYMSAEEANRKMESDWREKELPDQLIVLPGRFGSGFLYFKLPPGVTPRSATLMIEAEKLAERRRLPLKVNLP